MTSAKLKRIADLQRAIRPRSNDAQKRYADREDDDGTEHGFDFLTGDVCVGGTLDIKAPSVPNPRRAVGGCRNPLLSSGL